MTETNFWLIRHAMAGNLCRCGTYPKIELAILRASEGSR